MKAKIIGELRPEYEFDYSKAARGKYFKRLLEEGANVVVLEHEIAKAFTSSAAVNDALRSLLEITRSPAKQINPPDARKTARRLALTVRPLGGITSGRTPYGRVVQATISTKGRNAR